MRCAENHPEKEMDQSLDYQVLISGKYHILPSTAWFSGSARRVICIGLLW
ncbi:MAG: hypothetical protein ABI415_10815 [Flavitalea sp.]